MKSKKEIKVMLKRIEDELLLQKLTLTKTGHLSKSKKKQLEEFIKELQNEVDLLNWVLCTPSNLPF